MTEKSAYEKRIRRRMVGLGYCIDCCEKSDRKGVRCSGCAQKNAARCKAWAKVHRRAKRRSGKDQCSTIELPPA